MSHRIVQSLPVYHANHRNSIEECPHCDHSMSTNRWLSSAKTLILEPSIRRSGYVATMTDCPMCHEPSWIHVRMDSFSKYSTYDFPEAWINRVSSLLESQKLNALREWGRALCWRCSKLESGDISASTSRTCAIGFGPAMTKCDSFVELK